jgi:acetyl-CoA acetyltransferase
MKRSGGAAIVGIGQTEFSKNSGRSELQLAAEASRAALEDAGIDPADVDGMITFTLDSSDEIGLSRCLGVRDLAYATRIPGGGAASVATVAQAMAVVESGLADIVLIWRAMNERSAYRFGQPIVPQGGGLVNIAGAGTGSRSVHALWRADAGELGVLARITWRPSAHHNRPHVRRRSRHAATNPAAWFYGRPITLEEHQQSRWIVEPVLRLLDCCQESDGGVALVVTSLERARDLRQPPVRVLGAAQSIPAEVEVISNYYHADHGDAGRPWNRRADLRRALGTAPGDAMRSRCSTTRLRASSGSAQLEGFGFCGRGEAKDCATATSSSASLPTIRRRTDRRGVHQRHEQHHRGGAPGARHGR